jgi:hypothetical protein
MRFRVQGLTRALIAAAILASASLAIISCGGGSSSSSAQQQHTLSGFAFRVFVSNPLFPTATGNQPVINIVDATRDVLSTSFISLLTSSPQAGLMALSPNLKYTMVFSPSGNIVGLIDNTTEAVATNGTVSVSPITLPGYTESMLFGNDNATGYAAIPTAPVIGQPPGAVVAMSLLNGTVTATIPVSGAHFIVISPDGNRILVFGNSPNSVTVIATALVGSNEDPRSTVCCFDHPVWGVFSSDSRTAYIFDCGPEPECGGKTAGITLLTVGSSTAGSTTPVSAATYGMLSGSTLYVAGTPPNTPCGSGTAAKTCGTLNIINTSSMTVTNSTPIIITDGYHDRMQISQDGQLFIGAHSCSNVNSGVEVRGCLSIFNTNNSSVVIPPQIGDVTAIQPIAGRQVVYVIQNASLSIYDTVTDKLQFEPGNGLNNNGQVDIVGQLADMKLVDPPP